MGIQILFVDEERPVNSLQYGLEANLAGRGMTDGIIIVAMSRPELLSKAEEDEEEEWVFLGDVFLLGPNLDQENIQKCLQQVELGKNQFAVLFSQEPVESTTNATFVRAGQGGDIVELAQTIIQEFQKRQDN